MSEEFKLACGEMVAAAPERAGSNSCLAAEMKRVAPDAISAAKQESQSIAGSNPATPTKSQTLLELVELLIDLAQTGDCYCSHMNVYRGLCETCKLRAKYAEVPQTDLDKLREIVKNNLCKPN